MQNNYVLLERADLASRIDILISTGRYEFWFRTTTENLLLGRETKIGGPMHHHTMFDVHYVLKGRFYLILKDERILIKPGMIVILAPNVPHTTDVDPASAEVCQRGNFKLAFVLQKNVSVSERAIGIGSDSLVEKFSQFENYTVINDTFSCFASTQRIAQEFLRREVGYYQLAQAEVLSIIASLGRNVGVPRSKQHHEKKLTNMQMEIFEEFFGSSVTSECNQKQLSDLLHISTRQLNRVLMDVYGTSFRQKLMESRVERAKCLLATTDLSLSEIAMQCGYCNDSSLCHAFTKCTGISPNDYRRQTAGLLPAAPPVFLNSRSAVG